LDSEEIRRKILSDEQRGKKDAEDSALSSIKQEVEESNDLFIGDQKQNQKQIIKDQDKALGHLDKSLTQLQGRANAINTEIKEQIILIDGLEKDVDEANNRILTVNEALGKLLGTKDNCQIWTVVILAAILIILGKIILNCLTIDRNLHYNLYL
jgi:DNA repair exonuclease SbcCD ATPase subunit